MRMRSRIPSIILSLLLAMSLFPAGAFAAGPEAISREAPSEISSASAFLDFASGCVLDSYSKGKSFILTKDIDVSGLDFSPVQCFYGSFDGNGHSISGLDVSCDGSRQGLFRRVGEGAVIKNLIVKGSVTPSGTSESVGGIAGENAGVISNCSFYGNINAVKTAGGIAGINLPAGVISSCTFTGSISAEHGTGGIAGENRGVIISCENKGDICKDPIDKVTKDEFSVATFDISSLTTDDFLNVSDIGGIAGLNSGTVSGCESSGTVGYNYQGYNVGGIAGRSSGYIESCVNSGEVFAQSDAGGICWQLEPYLDVVITEDTLASLGARSSQLTYMTGSLTSTVDSSIGFGNDIIYEMAGYADAIAAEIEKLSGEDLPDFPSLPDIPVTGGGDEPAPEIPDNPVTDAFDFDTLTSNISGLYGSASELVMLVGDSSVVIADEVSSIVKELTAIVNDLTSAVRNAGGAIVTTEDVSVTEAYKKNTGAVSKCENSGKVSADSNAGGIVGISSMELSFDIAEQIDLSDYFLTVAKTVFFAVVRDCSNTGDVNVRDSNAGGAAGYMTAGAVVNSRCDCSVSAAKGDCVGGIVGLSRGSVNGCYARSTLSGGKYIGGITGNGGDLESNTAYASVSEGREYLGAVSGWTDGNLKDNKYVDCGLGAIDGASYEGKAEPVSYAAMNEIKDIPSFFLPVKVVFVAEGRTVASYDVEFGGSLYEYPAVPVNENGQSWKWDEYQHEKIFTGFTVEGAYQSPVPVLATAGEEPEFLAEGDFIRGMVLSADAFTPENLPVTARSVIRAATVNVSDYEGKLKVHMRVPDGGNLFILDADGELQPCGYVRDGSYIVFDADNGASVVYAEGIANTGVSPYIIAGAALALIGILVLISVKRIKKSRAKSAVSDNTGENGNE